jgi:type I restriction enzyme R subunit
VSDEKKIGRGHLDRFMELETLTPTIVTTSQMLTTGVDVQTCKNVVLTRVINSMTEFKQIIGRGTRVRDDYGKLFFNILDYTGSATQMFAYPDFDGDPVLVTEEEMDEKGEKVGETEIITEEEDEGGEEPPIDTPPGGKGEPGTTPRKYYVDNGSVEIAATLSMNSMRTASN